MPLDLDLNDEQTMLADMVSGVLAKYSSVAEVRALEDDATGYSAELWEQLGQLGLIGLLMPERHGGSGMSMGDAVIVYKEFGRALASTPHFVCSVLAGGAIERGGSGEQHLDWLPGITSGQTVWTVAIQEATGGDTPAGIRTTATPGHDGYRLSGTKRHVFFASAANMILVAARTDDGHVDLFAVEADDAGISMTQKFSIASDTQYDVTFEGVSASRLGEVGSGWDTWTATMRDGAILAAAQAVGGAERALELTVDYSKERRQFDKALAEFQALSHDMANAKTAIDGADVLVHQAAWARDTGRDIAKLAPMAKLFACDTYRDTTAVGQQIFGGMGFTLDEDIQLYFRRAKSLQLNWWGPRTLERLIAAEVLDR